MPMIDSPTTEHDSRSNPSTSGNPRLRDMALACLGGGFVLSAVALGVFASKDGSMMLTAGLGVPGIALLALFGIVWDSQQPRTQTLAERIRPGMRHLACLALVAIYVGWRLWGH